jgi:hypothetical protein
MAFLAPQLVDFENAERRRHPAIFLELPPSAQFGPQKTDEIYLEQLRASAERSRYVELEQAFTSLRDQLVTLRSLENGWDSYRAAVPNRVALGAAEVALDVFRSLNVQPSAVLPSADGGVGICFTRDQGYAHIEFENTGDTWVMAYGANKAPETWQLLVRNANSLKGAWNHISAYLQS